MCRLRTEHKSPRTLELMTPPTADETTTLLNRKGGKERNLPTVRDQAAFSFVVLTRP